MSDKSGWIKVYRKIDDCPLWWEERFSYGQAWIDLLLMANHRPKVIMFDATRITIETGQLLTSIRKLSHKWDWSVKRTMRFLNNLEAEKMIVRDSNAKRTLITIVNYGIYQGGGNSDDNTEYNTECNSDYNTDCTQTRSKEIKNINNVAPKEQRDQDIKDFEVIYQSYPKKKAGKQKALKYYLGWTSSKGRYVNGRYVKLTNRQVWFAVQNYLKLNEDTEQQFLKNFDTLMNQILDYVEDGE